MTIKVTAIPCDNGALYYRRAGHVFNVGQPVEIEVSTEVEAELRASRRLQVEAVEIVVVPEKTEGSDDDNKDDDTSDGSEPDTSARRVVKKSRSTT